MNVCICATALCVHRILSSGESYFSLVICSFLKDEIKAMKPGG